MLACPEGESVKAMEEAGECRLKLMTSSRTDCIKSPDYNLRVASKTIFLLVARGELSTTDIVSRRVEACLKSLEKFSEPARCYQGRIISLVMEPYEQRIG